MIEPENYPASEQEAVKLEGMPTLARGRMPEDFAEGDAYVYLFDPKWRWDEEPELVIGTITDPSPIDRPYRLGLPLGISFEVLLQEARLLRGEDFITLKSYEPSELPDLPRQIVLNRPELRSKAPSVGHVTLETPHASVPRIIGVSMNDNALIPVSAMPLLQRDEDFRTAWLLDGPEDLESRSALEKAIREWRPERAEAASGRRARMHAHGVSHKVRKHRDTSMDTFSADRV